MKTKTLQVIDVSEWDDLVEKTYGRPYSLQQQDGCKERGMEYITVPEEDEEDYYGDTDTIEEKVNTSEMGVSFKAWLERDPNLKLKEEEEEGDTYNTRTWWECNFYPSIEMVANDLYKRGLIEAGEYGIDIDW